jgi:predicted transposase YbfD/YdcC
MPRNPAKIDYSGGLPLGFEHFTIIEDPRTGGNCRHHFGEMIFIAVSSLVCGVQSFGGMIEFAHIHRKWLDRWITLPNGIPVVQTMINLFALLNPVQFSRCIAAHIHDLYPELAQQLIAVDGKTIRGSGKTNHEQQHCLSAYAAEAGLTLGVEFVAQKSNEITAIPKLFDQLDIAGHLVSVDAMGTQTAIAADIRSKDADYLMAVKRNQGSLHDEIVDQFHFATTQSVREKSPAWDLHEQVGKANGRITTRRVAVTGQLDWMLPSIRKRWRDLASLIMVESESYDIIAKKTHRQKRFYISSKAASAEQFSQWIRGHWSIENGCHWVLDTLYREDHSQVRIANAVKNFAILRRIAHNLLKSDKTSMKSLPMKQMRAMADDQYRNLLLSLAG